MPPATGAVANSRGQERSNCSSFLPTRKRSSSTADLRAAPGRCSGSGWPCRMGCSAQPWQLFQCDALAVGTDAIYRATARFPPAAPPPPHQSTPAPRSAAGRWPAGGCGRSFERWCGRWTRAQEGMGGWQLEQHTCICALNPCHAPTRGHTTRCMHRTAPPQTTWRCSARTPCAGTRPVHCWHPRHHRRPPRVPRWQR